MTMESSTAKSGARTASISSDALTPDVIRDVLQDRSTSYWLARSHAELLARDPVDALNDAHFLYQAMLVRWDELQVTALRYTVKQSGDCGDG